MSRRTGTTLVEVLVAIFVMGIGLIALLTLFPIGILRMGFALKQQRAQDTARNADAVAVIYNIRNDSGTAASPGVVADGTVFDYFSTPGGGLPAADPYGPSYPLFVDPLGYASYAGTASQAWVGGTAGVLRRRPVSFAGTTNAASIKTLYFNFSLWDDINYEPTTANPNAAAGVTPGTPQSVTANPLTVPRETRFSWGYTMRRPMASEKGVVDCSIVVFDGRSLSTAAGGGLTFSEDVYQNTAYFNPANGTITIDYTALPFGPPIRAGDWIMDVTFVPVPATAPFKSGSAHAFWYRVVATEDLVVGGKKLARYEVQQPIRGFEAPLGTNPAAFNPLPNTMPYNAVDPTVGGAATSVYQGSIVFMDAVVEVFEKGPARLP
jgi:hypothetical protein